MPVETYRGFVARPHTVTTRGGEVLELSHVLVDLRRDIENAQALMQWEIDTNGANIIAALETDATLPASEQRLQGNVNTTAARLGLTLPNIELASGHSGRSRYAEMVYGEVIASCRSWSTRIHATRGTGGAFVSRGFKRTARDTKPTMPYRLNLGYTTGGQYAKWDSEQDGSLHLVVDGSWVVLHFDIPKRYTGALGLPTIQLDSATGRIAFHLLEKQKFQQGLITTRYVVGVDVGKAQYATAAVWDSQEEKIVHSETLSARVHSLWNSIRATER